MDTFIDHYAVLEVDANASPTEIKTAFKKLALQYHPDVYKASDANERMSQILQAYRILSNRAERELYDIQRARHVGTNDSASKTTSSSYVGKRQNTGAHRDRQRTYVFPNVKPGQSLSLNLVEISYTLSPGNAQNLIQQGLLRGVEPLTKNKLYYCHRCHAHWKPIVGRQHISLPNSCPTCMAPDWAEYLLLRCVHCCAIFESEQIRYAIGAYTYGKSQAVKKTGLCPPYELFPLCPSCGRAHWCPSEENRVHKLRTEAAKRANMLRLVVMVGAIILLIVVGMFAFSLVR